MNQDAFLLATILKNCLGKKSRLFLIILPLFIVMVFGNASLIEVYAQEGQQNIIPLTGDNSNVNNTRTFEVTFDSLTIDEDHDLVFGGKWVINACVKQSYY